MWGSAQHGDERSGGVPNLFWRSMRWKHLRLEDNFVALPRVEDVVVRGHSTYRFVRQNSDLWAELHEGMLTTSNLKDLLGFSEQAALRMLGGGPRADHGPLLRACSHLRDTLPAGQHAEAGCVPRRGARNALRRNKRIVAAYNQHDGATVEPAATPTECDNYCIEAARNGFDNRVRVRWGTVQEAATLCQLMQMYPCSRVHEAGLFVVSLQQLAAVWGYDPDSLPPLGASPDAVITHAVYNAPQMLLDVVQAADTAAALGAGAGVDDAAWDAIASERLLQLALHRVYVKADTTDEDNLSEDAEEELLDEFITLLEFAGVDVDAFEGSCESASASANSTALRPMWVAYDSEYQGPVLYIREAVEVKNTCPFQPRAGKPTRRGNPRVSFHIADRGPQRAVLPQWVPQMQMHMLATGCLSLLLVSRSATRGVRVYRMFRDDGYLRLMLLIVSRVYKRYARAGQQPPHDMFSSDPDYKLLLNRTGGLARRASLTAVSEETLCPPGADLHAFFFYACGHAS